VKISYNWLKDYLNTDLEPQNLSKILTDIGLEVEGIETFEEVKGNLKGIVIGEVLSCDKHPNADKLSVTKVNIGQEKPLNIVCGAPNVAAGQKVVVATIGTELHMGEKSFTIQKTKLRGELSEGMICAEDEIGLGTSHKGIMVLDDSAEIGKKASDYFNLKTDTVFEIGLTPNRIDAGSHYGVARDLAAYFSQFDKTELKMPDVSAFKSGNDNDAVRVTVEDTTACKRYTGLTIKDVQVAPSPKWLADKLKSIGLNPINNIVDITNFVLHELGQPLHAFDSDKLSGNQIVVKKMTEGTKFTTLDDEERILSAEDLMICDARDGACLAGILGGIDSGVSEKTKNLFLESAYFDPVSVRKSAKRHGLSTDSSFRFERGVDPEMTLTALKRAALLIQDIANGKISSEVTDIYPEQIEYIEIDVCYSHIDRLIGKKLDKKVIKNILQSLEIEIIKESDNDLQLRIPPYRVDVTREADVIEEILRIYGYNNVEFSEKVNASWSQSDKIDNESLINKVADYLASAGYNEIMSNSLTKSIYYQDLKTYPVNACVGMLNPLSNDLNVLRQSLIFSGLEAISYNINRQNSNLRLFEFGRCYQVKGKTNEHYPLASYSEENRLTIYLSGNKFEDSWTLPEEKVSFFHLKAYCEQIFRKAGISVDELQIRSLEDVTDVFSGGLAYISGNKKILEIGSVHPKLLKVFDIEQQVFCAEFRWDLLLKKAKREMTFKELPRFPEVRRDLALLINENVEFKDITAIARKNVKDILRRINLFDYYQGKSIPNGKKSYGVSFYLQHEEKTLTDKEIDKAMNAITSGLKKEIDAELR
jgi:phenylalanyl-tRNA synthetase beta chain